MAESVKAEIALTGTSQNLMRNTAVSFDNLGENYFKLGEKEKGLAMLQKNLEISRLLAASDDKNLEAQIDVSNAYVTFANAYEKFGDYPKAIESAKNVLQILEKTYTSDNKNGEVSNGIVLRTRQLAGLLEKTNQANEAKVYRTKAAEMCKLEINASSCTNN